MPQINLLSPVPKKKEARVFSAKPSQVEFGQLLPILIRRGIASVVVISIFWITLFVSISKKEKILKGLEVKAEELASNPEEKKKIDNENTALEKKVKLIDELSSRKFFWYQKLDLITELIPDGIWLTEVYSKQQKVTSKVTQSEAKPKESGSSTKDSQATIETEKTVFVIKGTAVAYKIQDAVGLIGDFIKNLQSNEEFSHDFSEIKLNTIAKGIVGGLDVMHFDLLCETK